MKRKPRTSYEKLIYGRPFNIKRFRVREIIDIDIYNYSSNEYQSLYDIFILTIKLNRAGAEYMVYFVYANNEIINKEIEKLWHKLSGHNMNIATKLMSIMLDIDNEN